MIEGGARNRRWEDFLEWLAERQFPHLDDRWRRHARSEEFAKAVFGRRVADGLSFTTLGELLRLALEQLVAEPDLLPPAARLVEPVPSTPAGPAGERQTIGAVVERLGGRWNPVRRRWAIQPAWAPALTERAESSLTIAWLAYLPIWRDTDPEHLLPIHDLLRFHEFGPGFSAGALVYELVEAVLTAPDRRALRELTTERQGRRTIVTGLTWNRPAVAAVMAARRDDLCQDLWIQPPLATIPTEPATLPDRLQRDYLIGMRAAGISQQRAGDEDQRLSRSQLADLRLNLRPWWEDLRKATSFAAPAIRWTALFLPTLDACSTRGLGPRSAGHVQLQPHRLPTQIAGGFPGWNEVATPLWSGSLNVQRFGRRPIGDVQHAFQTLAGLYGPRFLTSERANPGRQRYPEYVGGIDRNQWLARKLDQLGAEYYRVRPEDLELLGIPRHELDELRAARQVALWEAIAELLNGDDPTLPVDQADADLLAEELQEYATRDRIGESGVPIRRFAITGDQWASTAPDDPRARRIALWKVLFDQLEARGLRKLRDAARPAPGDHAPSSDIDDDVQDDGAAGHAWDHADADGQGDDADADE